MTEQGEVYAGFWLRAWAALLDSMCLSALLIPAGLMVYGASSLAPASGWLQGSLDLLLHVLLPFLLVYWFWRRWLATPGKMLLGCQIIDARTGQAPSQAQLLIRYVGYFISLLPAGLGFLWVLIDPRKQGWHDKLAGTVVAVVAPSKTRRALLLWMTLLSSTALATVLALSTLWLWRNAQNLQSGWVAVETAQDQGILYGIGTPAGQCVTAAATRLAECRGFFCGYQGALFLGGCLPSSLDPEVFCSNVPGGLAALASSQWQLQQCRSFGQDNWSCLQMMTVPVVFCRRFSSSAPEPAGDAGFVH